MNKLLDNVLNMPRKKYSFIIESFPLEKGEVENETSDDPAEYQIDKALKNYDESWELLNVFSPTKKEKRIRIFLRKVESID